MFYTLLLVLDLVSALAPFESCDPVSVSPVGHATVRKNRGETSQGGALLCPGLSHFAPLGRRNEKTAGAVRLIITLWNVFRRFRLTRSQRRRI